MTPIKFTTAVLNQYVDLDKFLQDQGIAPGDSKYQRRTLLERVRELLEKAKEGAK